MQQAWFDGWPVLARTALVGVLAYAALVALLRASGKRTLAKMNAFDLVVTVALGSTLATILLDRNVSLAQGVLAFALLAGLQFTLTWSSVRIARVRAAVTGEPTLLFYRGEFMGDALKRSRVTEQEARAAIRAAGCYALAEVEAVILETNGTFSVVRPKEGAAGLPTEATSLADVRKEGR